MGIILCVIHVTYFVIILCESPEPHGARGDACAGNLSTASGDHLFGKP
jgi:hypothetical protein